MNILELINIGSKQLRSKKIPSHIIDAEILLSKTLNKTREEILINLDKKINKKSIYTYQKYLNRRSKSEPIAYILQEKEFWSNKFEVNRDTLIPRPETELLVEKLIDIYKEKRISILDIGTGSGCIIVSLLGSLKNSQGIGIDISKSATTTARKNGIRHNLLTRLKFLNRSLNDIFNKKFDLIVSNPPYIKRNDIKNLIDDVKNFEPKIALDGGNDGLDLIKKVIYKSKNILKIKGLLALEIGNEQIKKVSKLLFDNNFRIKNVINDYKNNVRCVIADFN